MYSSWSIPFCRIGLGLELHTLFGTKPKVQLPINESLFQQKNTLQDPRKQTNAHSTQARPLTWTKWSISSKWERIWQGQICYLREMSRPQSCHTVLYSPWSMHSQNPWAKGAGGRVRSWLTTSGPGSSSITYFAAKLFILLSYTQLHLSCINFHFANLNWSIAQWWALHPHNKKILGLNPLTGRMDEEILKGC